VPGDPKTGYARAANGVTYGPFAITDENLAIYGDLTEAGPGLRAGRVHHGGKISAVPVTWQQDLQQQPLHQAVEGPCKSCGKPNDVGVRVCWFCGGTP
jgi:hypothetical protein